MVSSFVPLVPDSVYRVGVTASTDAVTTDTIPYWGIKYDNFYDNAHGNTYGGQATFLDGSGGANGIGRPNGRTEFEFWIAPNAALTQSWNGTVDPSNGAFDLSTAAFRDMNLTFFIDDTNEGIHASQRSGTICVTNLRVDRFDINALTVAEVVYDAAISNATYVPQTSGEALALSAGTSWINDAEDKSAHFQIPTPPSSPVGAFTTKTLFPFTLGAATLNVSLRKNRSPRNG